MPKIQLFYIFLTSLFTSLVLIPTISRLAISIGIFDGTDERKVHKGAIPRLGGIAIFFAFLLGVILFSEIDRTLRGCLAGAIVIFLTGLTDDLAQLPPKKKLLGQILAALIVTVAGGVRLTSLGNIFGTGAIELDCLAIPFTVFCIVGVINAVNLLDGLDGLAGGVSAIATSSIAILAYLSGNHNLVAVCVALLGGIVGFLKFNTYPARIFMGDGGSLFLGYCLAVMSVDLVQDSHGANSVLTPLIILAVPIFDTLFVMGKRLLKRKGLFMPDRTHIHHRFMDHGLGHKSTVVLVYGLSYFLAAYAVVFRGLSDQVQLINIVLLLALFCLMNWVLTTILANHQQVLPREDEESPNVYAYRWMVRTSHRLLVLVKYLTLVVLGLTLLTYPSNPSVELAIVAALLILLTVLLYLQTADWSNLFLQIVLFFNGAFLIFVAENSPKAIAFIPGEFKDLSACLFAALFLCSGGLLLLRRKSKMLIDSPLEYVLLFIVITIPLLPVSVTQPIHLLTVAGKSLVLFLSYKMTFLLDVRRNRKVITATVVALLFVVLRGLF